MKNRISALVIILSLVATTFACKKAVKPVSERIAKVWSARLVTEGTSTVYQKGQSSNIKPGYVNYKLDLSSPTVVKLTEFEGNIFTGTWAVTGDKTLTLSGLNPSPTGANGTLTFNIDSITDEELKLTASTAYQKTGSTINVYTLSPQ